MEDRGQGAAHPAGWTFGADGVAFGTFTNQGGRRGRTQFRSQNWVMGMASRPLGSGMFTATGMLSAEPLTVGAAGYSEIFQQGESYRGLQNTDRQHPHDLLMQLAAAWRVPLGDRAGFTLAGGPVGEATLGPAAFMHRPSSAENPIAPLSHHTFDSTHVAMGVVMAALDRGPFAVEGSLFRGREPDEHRWDLDPGALDSWAVRGWFRPSAAWAIQVSHGVLNEPEQLEPGDQRRTNGSISWLRERESGFTAVTAAAGRTVRRFATTRAVLVEATHQAGRTSVFGRVEALTVETEILLFPQVVHVPHPGELIDPLRAASAGAVLDLADLRGVRIGVGGDVYVYSVPRLLQVTHGDRPISFHMFVRVRPPSKGPRMWNMTLGQPMQTSGHAHR